MVGLVKKYIKGYGLISVLGPLFKLLEAVIEIFIPLIVKDIIDKINKGCEIPYVLKMSSLMLGCYIAGFAFSFICQYFAAVSAFGFGHSLKSALYKHVNSLPLADINCLGASSLIVRVNIDTANVQNALNRFIRLVTRAPYMLVGSLIMAVIINPQLSLIFFGASVLIGLTLFLVMSAQSKKIRRINLAQDELALKTRENLSGARVIRAFNKQGKQEEGFKRVSSAYKKESIILGTVSALTNPLTYLIINGSIICIVYFGALKVSSGALTVGEIVALNTYLLQILNALVIIAMLAVLFARAASSAKRINEVFAASPEVIGGETGFGEGDTALEFKNVSMKYPQSVKNALEDISFTLLRGQTLGIIGGTGAGKTSLISLIPRLYEYDGEINFFGRDLKSINVGALRGAIGVADQKAILFSGTLRENMLLSKSDATDEEITDALSVAQCDFITSPSAITARGGSNFSGGQRQRLCIARAVIKKPELLILDDAASALDYATEAKLWKELKKLNNLTKIIVSQRAVSINRADLIIVLDEGKAVGIGTHKQLINSCAVYREINEIQGGTL